MPYQKITLAGGCFWCLEAIFQDVKGVIEVMSGYSGGTTKDPTYQEVSSGSTGHAEVVELTFDPSEITLAEILQIFFTLHDPTTLNRQGADIGTQYRSAIFYRDDIQKATAQAVIKEFDDAGTWGDPIVTEVAPFEAFYPAEEYHKNYYKNNPDQAYCRIVIEPKVTKLRKMFLDKLRTSD